LFGKLVAVKRSELGVHLSILQIIWHFPHLVTRYVGAFYGFCARFGATVPGLPRGVCNCADWLETAWPFAGFPQVLAEFTRPSCVFFAHSAANGPVTHEFQHRGVYLLGLNAVFLHEVAHYSDFL
jgi:hypothetical protein